MTALDWVYLLATALAVVVGGRVAWRDRRLTARVAALELAEQARGDETDELELARAVGVVSDESDVAATVLLGRVPMSGDTVASGVLGLVPDPPSDSETTARIERVLDVDAAEITAALHRSHLEHGRHSARRAHHQ